MKEEGEREWKGEEREREGAGKERRWGRKRER